MNDRSPKIAEEPRLPQGRQARKQRTRQALMSAALELLEERAFSALSLREVARAAGVVPTAFYRHFASMDELGLAIVDDAFRALRGMLRDARGEGAAPPDDAVRRSAEVLVRHVRANRSHFRFVARERYGGAPALRHAIRGEIRLFASELATDLTRYPVLARWRTEDLHLLAGLIVNLMVTTVEALLDVPPDDEDAEAEVLRNAERQLRMVLVGVPGWRPG